MLRTLYNQLLADNPVLIYLNARALRTFRRWGWVLFFAAGAYAVSLIGVDSLLLVQTSSGRSSAMATGAQVWRVMPLLGLMGWVLVFTGSNLRRLLHPHNVEPLFLSHLSPLQIWAAVMLNLNRNLLIVLCLALPMILAPTPSNKWPVAQTLELAAAFYGCTNVLGLLICVAIMQRGLRFNAFINVGVLSLLLLSSAMLVGMVERTSGKVVSPMAQTDGETDEPPQVEMPLYLTVNPFTPFVRPTDRAGEGRYCLLGIPLPFPVLIVLGWLLLSAALIVWLISGPMRLPAPREEEVVRRTQQPGGKSLLARLFRWTGRITETRLISFANPNVYTWRYTMERLYENVPRPIRLRSAYWQNATFITVGLLLYFMLIQTLCISFSSVNDLPLILPFIVIAIIASFRLGSAREITGPVLPFRTRKRSFFGMTAIAFALMWILGANGDGWLWVLEGRNPALIGYGLLLVAAQTLFILWISSLAQWPRQSLLFSIGHICCLTLAPLIVFAGLASWWPRLLEPWYGLGAFCSLTPVFAIGGLSSDDPTMSFYDSSRSTMFHWHINPFCSIGFLFLEILLFSYLLWRQRRAKPNGGGDSQPVGWGLPHAETSSPSKEPHGASPILRVGNDWIGSNRKSSLRPIALALFYLLLASPLYAVFNYEYPLHVQQNNSYTWQGGSLHYLTYQLNSQISPEGAGAYSYGSSGKIYQMLVNDSPSTLSLRATHYLTADKKSAQDSQIILLPYQAEMTNLKLGGSVKYQYNNLPDEITIPHTITTTNTGSAYQSLGLLSPGVPRLFLSHLPQLLRWRQLVIGSVVCLPQTDIVLPENAQQLRPFAGIFLDGQKTAMLSPKQIAALEVWVANGGVLFLDPAALRQLGNAPFLRGAGVDLSLRQSIDLAPLASVVKSFLPSSGTSGAGGYSYSGYGGGDAQIHGLNANPAAAPTQPATSEAISPNHTSIPVCPLNLPPPLLSELQTVGEPPALAAWRYGQGVVSVQTFEGEGDRELMRAWTALQLNRISDFPRLIASSTGDFSASPFAPLRQSNSPTSLYFAITDFLGKMPAFAFVSRLWDALLLWPFLFLAIYIASFFFKRRPWRKLLISFSLVALAAIAILYALPQQKNLQVEWNQIIAPLPGSHWEERRDQVLALHLSPMKLQGVRQNADQFPLWNLDSDGLILMPRTTAGYPARGVFPRVTAYSPILASLPDALYGGVQSDVLLNRKIPPLRFEVLRNDGKIFRAALHNETIYALAKVCFTVRIAGGAVSASRINLKAGETREFQVDCSGKNARAPTAAVNASSATACTFARSAWVTLPMDPNPGGGQTNMTASASGIGFVAAEITTKAPRTNALELLDPVEQEERHDYLVQPLYFDALHLTASTPPPATQPENSDQ